jgi:DNA-binding transcriptional LysR family regulator
MAHIAFDNCRKVLNVFANIETFIAVIEAGSFAGAARRLGLSPALVGRRIQALEEHYGVKLIERTTRSQRLTADGEAFLPRAEQLVSAAEALEETTRGERAALEGRIRISGPLTLGIRRVAPLIAGFRRDHPGVTVELSLADRRVDLIAEGFDFAIRVGELPPSSLIARRIGTYRFAVVASPDWVARHGAPVHPDDLQSADCLINLNMRPRNAWPFEGPEGRFEVTVSGGLQIDNGEAQRAVAVKGAGVAYLPVEEVGADLAAGRLVKLLPDWPTMTMPVYLVHPTRRLVPARVSALMDAVAGGLGLR